MFGRFVASLVNQAVEVVAPPIKSSVEALNHHFGSIRQFYQELADKPAGNLDQLVNNIPFHMQSILVILQQEHQQDQQDDGDLTGIALESVLQQRILAQLVQWAVADKPAGMLTETARFFAGLLSSVHHRLLPEGQVRQPLEHLVKHLRKSADPSLNIPINAELIKLLFVLFDQIESNPALLNLFVESDQVVIFEYAIEFTDSPDFQVASAARKTVILALRSIVISHSKVVVKSSLAIAISNAIVALFSICTAPAAPSNSYKSLMEYWTFANEVVSVCGNSKFDIGEGESSLKYTLTQQMISKIFQEFIFEKLSVNDSDQDITVQSMEVFSDLLRSTNDQLLAEGIIESLMDDSKGGAVLMTTAKRLVSNLEQVSLAAFKIFDFLVGSYNNHVFNRLILSEIPINSMSTATVKDHADRIGEFLRISTTVLGRAYEGGSKLENYFLDAQEFNEECFFHYQTWPKQTKIKPFGQIDFLEIILSQFDRFFSNSIRKNLAISSVLSKIAHLPHPELQDFLLMPDDNNDSHVGHSSSLFGRIHKISVYIHEIYDSIPELKEKVYLIRSACDDDMMSIIHRVGRAPLSIGLDELRHLLSGESDPWSSAGTEKNQNLSTILFANFLPQVLIFSEFCKELAVIMFLVNKTLETDERASKSATNKLHISHYLRPVCPAGFFLQTEFKNPIF